MTRTECPHQTVSRCAVARRWLGCFIFTCWAWSGQLAAQTEISVSGTALDSAGEPVAGAQVQLLRLDDTWQAQKALESAASLPVVDRGRTGASGRYKVVAGAAGSYLLTIERDGYRSAAHQLVLVGPADLRAIEMASARPFRVGVRSGGRPVPGARLRVTDSCVRQFGATWQRSVSLALYGATDEQGSWSGHLCEAAPDRGASRHTVTVEVVAAGHAPWLGEFPASEVGNRFEVDLDVGREVVVDVRRKDDTASAGALVQRKGMQLPAGWTDSTGRVLLRAPVGGGKPSWVVTGDQGTGRATEPVSGVSGEGPMRYRLEELQLSGQVIDNAGRPLAGALVWLTGQRVVRVDEQGRFDFAGWSPAREQSLRLYALAAGHARGEVIVGASGDSQVLRLQPTGSRRIRLVAAPDSGEEPMQAEAPLAPVQGVLAQAQQEQGNGFRPSWTTRVAYSDSDGLATLRDLEMGKAYRLDVSRDGFLPRQLPLTPDDGEGGVVQEIVLERSPIWVGWVEDPSGQVVVGARVNLLPAGTPIHSSSRRARVPPSQKAEASTDDRGRFQFSEVKLGTYDLHVRAVGFAPAVVTGLELVAKGPREVGTVTLAPGLTLRGAVVDAQERPLADAAIWALDGTDRMTRVRYPNLGENAVASAVAAQDGTFELVDLAARPHWLLATAEGHGVAQATVRLQEEGVADQPLQLQLQQAFDLDCLVVDDQERGLPHVLVSSRPLRPFLSGLYIDRSTSSGPEGTVRFEDLVPGSYPFQVLASNWAVPQLSSLEVSAEPPHFSGWAVGEDGSCILRLDRSGTVSGTVRFWDGTPASGAFVSLVQGIGPTAARGSGRAGADGRFEIQGAPTGQLTVSVLHDEAPNLTYETEVEPGRPLDLTLEQGFVVQGAVRDALGEPVAGAIVTAAPEGAGSWRRTEPVATDAQGAFEIRGLGEGQWVLRAAFEGSGSAVTDPALAVAADLEGVDLVLGDDGVLEGSVIGLEPSERSLVRLRLVPKDPKARSGRPLSGAPDYEGGFRFEDLTPGVWTVLATLQQTGRSERREIEIRGGEVARIDVEFRDGPRLSGVVSRGGTPLGRLMVNAEAVDREGVGVVTTDASGRFVLEGLPAGIVRVQVLDEFSIVAEREVELLADLEIEIELSDARLAGRVLDELGEVVAGVTVRMESGTTDSPTNAAQRRFGGVLNVDGNGRFESAGLAPGPLLVTGRAEGFMAAEQRVELVDGVTTTVELVLRRGDTLRFRVSNWDGSRPDSVVLHRLGDQEQVVDTRWSRVGKDGLATLEGVPTGAYRWYVAVSLGSGAVVLGDSKSAEPVDVRLPRVGAVELDVASLRSPEGALRARARFYDGAGRLHRGVGAIWADQHELLDGRMSGHLPLGQWTVEVTSLDGSVSLRKTFVVEEGTQQVVLGPG